MITLPELIERLRPPGRYLAFRYDREEDFEFYALMEFQEDGNAIELEELSLDFEALAAR